MSEGVFVSMRDNGKLHVLSAVDRGEISVKEAAATLHRSARQTKRILRAWRTQGALALAHGNRGRRPHNALPESLRENILTLLLSEYGDLTDQHASSMLQRQESIQVSRSTIRRIRESAGVPSVARRRLPKPRHRRQRMAQLGLLVQIDGSDHEWFGPPGLRQSLLAAIDDATGRILAACFRLEEDSAGYFLLLQQVLRGYGVPVAVYSDRHSIHFPQRGAAPSVHEQLSGLRKRTQFGRCLDDLGIIQVPAYSPQAKGRIERAFQTLQDRLPKELRLAGVQTVEQAHAFLPHFIQDYNAEFAVQPDNPTPAFSPVPPGLDWGYVFSKRFDRRVMSDNTVAYEGRYIPIPEGPAKRNYAKAWVELCGHLDGTYSIAYKGQRIAGPFQPQELASIRPPKATSAPAKPKAAPAPPKPAPDHPWKKGRFPLKTSGYARGNWYD